MSRLTFKDVMTDKSLTRRKPDAPHPPGDAREDPPRKPLDRDGGMEEFSKFLLHQHTCRERKK